MKSDVIIP